MLSNASTSTFAVLIATVTATFGCSSDTPARTSSLSPTVRATAAGLVLSPETIELGTLPAGGSARGCLTVHNPGMITRTLDRVETSCPCLHVGAYPSEIVAGETIALRVEFDSTEEPEFRGGLAIDLRGLGPGGEELFRTKVHVAVEGAAVGSP